MTTNQKLIWQVSTTDLARANVQDPGAFLKWWMRQSENMPFGQALERYQSLAQVKEKTK
jgi:hypothetical protein